MQPLCSSDARHHLVIEDAVDATLQCRPPSLTQCSTIAAPDSNKHLQPLHSGMCCCIASQRRQALTSVAWHHSRRDMHAPLQRRWHFIVALVALHWSSGDAPLQLRYFIATPAALHCNSGGASMELRRCSIATPALLQRPLAFHCSSGDPPVMLHRKVGEPLFAAPPLA